MINIKNIALNWSGYIAAIVYGFFMTPFIVRSLGDTSYGLWNLIAACLGYMGLLDFGIQTSVNRYVAKFRGLGDSDGINRIYSSALALYSCIGIVAVVSGIVLTLFVDRIFIIPGNEVLAVKKVMFIMSFYAALEFPSNVYGSIIYAYQRFDLLNGINIVMLSLQAVALTILLSGGGGLLAFALTVIACGLLKYTLYVVLSHRIVGGLRLKMSLVSRSTLRTMGKFSAVSFGTLITTYVISKTDNVVIGMFLQPQAITMYSIGFMLSEYSSDIVNAMCRTFTPAFSDYESRGEHDQIASLLIASCRASIAIGLPLISVAIVVGKDFIHLWMGQGYENAYVIMVILMCGRSLGYASRPMTSMLFGIGKHYICLYTGIVEACAHLVLSLVLIRTLGVIGVAWGAAIPMLLTGVVFPVIVCWSIGIKLSLWLKEGVLRSGIFSGCFLAGLWLLSSLFKVRNWPDLFLEVSAFTAVYAVLLLGVALRSHERESLLRMGTGRLSALLRRSET
jgi:O-antigen/teichoic acid export membrane protein